MPRSRRGRHHGRMFASKVLCNSPSRRCKNAGHDVPSRNSSEMQMTQQPDTWIYPGQQYIEVCATDANLLDKTDAHPRAPDDADAPNDVGNYWKYTVHASTDKRYYFNKETKEVQWDNPLLYLCTCGEPGCVDNGGIQVWTIESEDGRSAKRFVVDESACQSDRCGDHLMDQLLDICYD